MVQNVGNGPANNRSCIHLEVNSCEIFLINEEVAQGCSLSPMLFLIYSHGLLCEIKKHLELDVKFSKKCTVFCLPMIS